MDREEIVRQFLGRGYQLDVEALKFFEGNPEKVTKFLEGCSGLKDTFITKTVVETILEASSDNRTSGISAKSFRKEANEFSVDDIVRELNDRYGKTSAILLEKNLPNLISVNRISQQTKQFSLIVSLKDVNPGDKSLLVEDPTGSITVYVSDSAVGDFPYLLEDEVVGLVCDNEGTFENRVVKVMFPDIPFSSSPNKADNETFCVFLSGFDSKDIKTIGKLKAHLRNRKEDTVVFISGYDNAEKTRKIFPENFRLNFIDEFPVEYDVEGVKVFVANDEMTSGYLRRFKTSPENMMIQLLKKRHMSPSIDLQSGLDSSKLFVEKAPDIVFVSGYGKTGIMNYKGVTSISVGDMSESPVFWEVNLRTRENIRIDLT